MVTQYLKVLLSLVLLSLVFLKHIISTSQIFLDKSNFDINCETFSLVPMYIPILWHYKYPKLYSKEGSEIENSR